MSLSLAGFEEILLRMDDIIAGTPIVQSAKSLSTQGWLIMSSSLAQLKTHRVGKRCTLNLSRAEMSSRWCAVVASRGDTSSGVILVT
ncbi:hypothetical protein TNCV_2215301 [Trichonephila clavipes]|nr:hypothetical protein TNCV_2215301 [Trichonephila clavipes]